MICYPGAALPAKFKVTWSLRNYLNAFSFYTNCYREWILNTFIFSWCFLELFIEKFIPNINSEHAQDYSCPGATFAFCSHGEKLPPQGLVTGCCTTGNSPLKVAPGQRKTHVNSYRRPTVHRGKVDPEVMSCSWIMRAGPNCTKILKSEKSISKRFYAWLKWIGIGKKVEF